MDETGSVYKGQRADAQDPREKSYVGLSSCELPGEPKGAFGSRDSRPDPPLRFLPVMLRYSVFSQLPLSFRSSTGSWTGWATEASPSML